MFRRIHGAALLCLSLSACASAPLNHAVGSAPAASARPAPEWQDGQLVPTEKVAPLLAWVVDRMGVKSDVTPAVLASRKALAVTGTRVQLAKADETLKAIYVPGVVVLDSETFTSADPVEVSYLVHELVHHIQFTSGQPVACAAAREAEAYRLQDVWLAEQGLRPLHTADWIAAKARCGS